MPGHILNRMLDFRRYDRERVITTAGWIETEDLNVDSESKRHGVRYGGGATPWLTRETLDRIPVDFRDYSFIDFGSGKGAVLFQASDYPFKQIFGIEYAPELHEAALRNLRSFRSKTKQCRNITSVYADAGSYELSEGPWVLFFDIPFGVPIWQRVVENIQRAPRGEGTSYLIFMNYGWLPDAAEYVQGLPFLKLIHRGDTVLTFELTG